MNNFLAAVSTGDLHNARKMGLFSSFCAKTLMFILNLLVYLYIIFVHMYNFFYSPPPLQLLGISSLFPLPAASASPAADTCGLRPRVPRPAAGSHSTDGRDITGVGL